jgi:rod shape-determining protein MreB and related proteins
MAIFRSILGGFRNDLAIDLGTANTLVYLKGVGVVSDEPSVVAFRQGSSGGRQVLAIGAAAKSMLGRTSSSIAVSRPIRDGVISDFDATQAMLRHFVGKFCRSKNLIAPRMVICVPSGSTALEKRAVVESAKSVGAGEVYLVDQAIAAAIGAGMPVAQPVGNMMIDVGGGTTEIAVISLGGLVYSQSLRIAGDKIDEAIIQLIRRRHNIQIGERTAELVKIILGSASSDSEIRTVQIRGQDVAARLPKTVEISDEEIRQAIAGPLAQLVEATLLALEDTPPELISDIAENGIVLAGGGALLRNLDVFMGNEIKLSVTVSDDPLKVGVLGAGKLLDDPALLHQVALN